MIVKESWKGYTRTYSDIGVYIIDNKGVKFIDAIDVIPDKKYVETAEKITY